MSRQNPNNHVYTGFYTEKRSHGREQMASTFLGPDISSLAKTYFWDACSTVNLHYIAIVTICLVVLLSYMLPNISQKIHRTTELKTMKKILDAMAKEVSQAEAACLTVAEQLNGLGSVHDEETDMSSSRHDLAVSTSDSMRATQSAPVHVEKKAGFFRRIFFPYKNTSTKEIALMSYVYTDSFDKNENNTESNPAEPRNT